MDVPRRNDIRPSPPGMVSGGPGVATAVDTQAVAIASVAIVVIAYLSWKVYKAIF